jgi:hypothetical protein
MYIARISPVVVVILTVISLRMLFRTCLQALIGVDLCSTIGVSPTGSIPISRLPLHPPLYREIGQHALLR